MSKITVAEALDLPFRSVKQYSPISRYASGTLRLEPTARYAVEFESALPDRLLALPDTQSFVAAFGGGVQAYAAENGVVGIRVVLTGIETHDIDSSDYSFRYAAQEAMTKAFREHGVPAKAFTVSEAFDQPLRLVSVTAGSEYYAEGTLRLTPSADAGLSYSVALPDDDLPPDVQPGYLEAVYAGVQRFAEENSVTGIEVTLTRIQAHPIDSSQRAFEAAAFRAMAAALEAHGVTTSPFTGNYSL